LGVTVNAVHPGITATGIVDDIVSPLMKPFLGLIKRSLLTPQQGAAPVLRLATAPELAGVTGRYFVRDAEHRSPAVSYDRDLQQRVWAASHACVVIPVSDNRGSPAAS
jgi:NAD(P)-dependent dehydrogenase (short-subunit alcohol dehydrogenase family)